MLHKIIMSVSQGDTLSYVGFGEASCHVVSCLCKKVIQQETGCLLAESWQEIGVLGPTTCKELKTDNSHVSLETDSIRMFA